MRSRSMLNRVLSLIAACGRRRARGFAKSLRVTIDRRALRESRWGLSHLMSLWDVCKDVSSLLLGRASDITMLYRSRGSLESASNTLCGSFNDGWVVVPLCQFASRERGDSASASSGENG